jgi:vitamin B12 transporter
MFLNLKRTAPVAAQRACLRGLVLACLALNAPFICAQITLQPVVVSATRTPQPLQQVLADFTLIDHEQMIAQSHTSIAEVLRAVPGLEMSRTGGPGTVTGVSMRGGEGRFTAVLIDGVRVDSQSIGGATWQAIPLSQVDHIEVLRGPASSLYGSDAISGVVHIFTRKGSVQPQAAFSAGVDENLDLTQLSASGSGQYGPLDYAGAVSRQGSKGFSAVSNPSNASYNADDDGYRSHSASTRLGFQLTPAHRFEFNALRSHLVAQYDGFASSADDRSLHDLSVLGGRWSAQLNAAWHSQLIASESVDRYESRPSVFKTQTRLRQATWQNDWKLGAHEINATLEHRQDRLHDVGLAGQATPGVGDTDQSAVALGYGWRNPQWAVQARLRFDDDHPTGGLTLAWHFTPAWQISAAVGTAFRAPTLYNRFSEYGNAGLEAERSRHLEAALRYRLGDHEFSATAYRTQVRQMINFGEAGVCASSFGCYRNLDEALLKGLSLRGSTQWADTRLSASVDWQTPKDARNDLLLLRRARRHLALQLDRDAGAWALGGQLLAYSERFDKDSAGERQSLGGYAVLNANAQYRMNREWQVQMRLDNVLDQRYQTALDYGSAPRSVFLGLRWAPSF